MVNIASSNYSNRCLDSLDHMFTFVYLTYAVMALLIESVPSFLGVRIECLGDLARSRMAIAEADLRDRDIWGGYTGYDMRKQLTITPRWGRI